LELSAANKTPSQQQDVQTAVSIVGTDAPSRFSTRRLLRGMVDFKCEGCYRDSIEALAGIRAIRPQILLIEIHKLKTSVLDCAERARAIVPGLRVIIAMGFPERQALLECLMAGITGYLVRPFTSADLKLAIQTVGRGEVFLCPAAIQELATTFIQYYKPPAVRLTIKEREIMACLLLRNCDKEIAEKLGLEHGTIHAHLHNIYAKLKVHKRGAAVRKFLQMQRRS
jgi:DNA-binding NarL/FixJ family response regulator